MRSQFLWTAAGVAIVVGVWTAGARLEAQAPARSTAAAAAIEQAVPRTAWGDPDLQGNMYEMIHETRVIPLDGRPFVSATLDQDMGDGRGRWDGDTLVIDTRNFKERSVYRNANPDTLVLTERFSWVGPEQIRWTVTVNDPSTWTMPWTFSMPLTRDNVPFPQYECHEGNYGLRNILSAARAEEARAAAGR